MKIVKHLLKCYFKHIFIILVASKRQTYRFKSSLHVFLFRNKRALNFNPQPAKNTCRGGLVHPIFDYYALAVGGSTIITRRNRYQDSTR